MKPRLALLVALVVSPLSHAAEMNTLSADEAAAGWQLLFDGQSTEGWRNYQASTISPGWQVVDGTLARVGQAGDLVTIAEYGNFELQLEWRVETGGNSGVFIRAGEDDPYIFMSAPEVQMLDDANHRDGQSPLTSAGSNYALHPVESGIAYAAGNWNRLRILVDGNLVVQWLNGREVVRYELGSADWRARVRNSKFSAWPNYGALRRGHIGLQDHGDPVAFRNVKIRNLAD